MSIPKVGESSDGRVMHYSVGALIQRDDQYLLIDRAIPPFGYAGIAGHVDEGESALEAIIRETKEESGLTITNKPTLLFEEEVPWNWCSKDIGVHYWYVFECKVEGDIMMNYRETKSINWYKKDEIKKLTLEPIWMHWFKKLNIM